MNTPVRRIRRTVDPGKLALVSSKTGNRFSRAAFDSNYHETAALSIAEEKGKREGATKRESEQEKNRDGRRDNRRRVKGGAASICHSADGMSGENREIGPSRSCSNSPRDSRPEKLSAFKQTIPPLLLALSSFPRCKSWHAIFFILVCSSLESIHPQWPKRYFHPLSFPPYCVKYCKIASVRKATSDF